MDDNLENKLQNYLQLYWLRPENALLATLKSKIIEKYSFSKPSLDISCGDGLFMFLHLGGSFDFDFDYFKNTNAENFSHDSFIDIYDLFNEEYEVPIKTQATNNIDYGTDWKKSLLDKSEKVGIYDKLIEHDNNQKPFPLQDDFFKIIHSNSIYWIKKPETLLSEIHRMLSGEGIALLEVMTPHHFSTFEKISPHLSNKAIEILDRKRRDTMPGLKNYLEWKEIILGQGFEIVEVQNIYPEKFVIDIWNIGLRPISHLLIQMVTKMSLEERKKIKKEWVEIFFELFKPLLNLNTNYSFEKSPYLLFVIKKK